MTAQTITVLPTHPADARQAILMANLTTHDQAIAAARELMTDAALRADVTREAAATESFDVWVIGRADGMLDVVLYVTGHDEDAALENERAVYEATFGA